MTVEILIVTKYFWNVFRSLTSVFIFVFFCFMNETFTTNVAYSQNNLLHRFIWSGKFLEKKFKNTNIYFFTKEKPKGSTYFFENLFSDPFRNLA